MYILNNAILRWLRDAYTTYLQGTRWPPAWSPFSISQPTGGITAKIVGIEANSNGQACCQHDVCGTTCWEQCRCEASTGATKSSTILPANAAMGWYYWTVSLTRILSASLYCQCQNIWWHFRASDRGVFCLEQHSHRSKEVATQHASWLVVDASLQQMSPISQVKDHHQFLAKEEEDYTEGIALLTR